ncbi:HAD family hydrolase [Candidatus Hodarchaeum mangrovi]
MIKAIILDMDGLMVDTERLYYTADMLVAEEYGKKISNKVIEQMIGQKPLDSMQIFQTFLETEDTPSVLLEKRDLYFLEMLETDLQPMPGLKKFLDTFYRKIKLAISTGTQSKYLAIILRRLDLQKFFEVIQTSDKIKKGKPDPEIYFRTIERLNLYPFQCIALEDSSNGVKAAKQAGCYVIAIPSWHTKDQDFSNADILLENLIAARDHIISQFRIL